MSSTARTNIHDEIVAEEIRQDEKWGEQNHKFLTGSVTTEMADRAKAATDASTKNGTLSWELILAEEVFEAFSARTTSELREELVQVAAVTAQWIAAIDRKKANTDG